MFWCMTFAFGGWGIWGLCVAVGGWKLWNRISRRALPVHFLRRFCCMMYRLAVMHSLTGRWTDKRHYDANSSKPRHQVSQILFYQIWPINSSTCLALGVYFKQEYLMWNAVSGHCSIIGHVTIREPVKRVRVKTVLGKNGPGKKGPSDYLNSR